MTLKKERRQLVTRELRKDKVLMSDTTVKLENISKFYKIYNSPKDRLKEALHPFGKKFYKEFYALKNLDLEVKKGEILGIVGSNGSGKSSLLKLIAGVIQPSSGRIIVNGKISALLELGSGLNPEFNGIQNIHFSGTMMGFSRAEMEEKIAGIIAFADIGDFIYQPLKTYSSGMKARLGFALAINMEPEILVLDEVLSVGDELFRRKCYAKMEEFFKSNCTVLYVSHSMNSVNSVCSRAVLIDKGEIILDGAAKLVTMHYQKYLFAKSTNALKIKNEIIELNKDEEKKKDFTASLEKKEDKTAGKKERETESRDGDNEQEKQKAFYMPDFKPKSTIEYKSYDVEIYDIKIKTIDGKKVNALVMDENYIYSYKARFNINAENVVFGSRFKTVNGLFLSGMNSKDAQKKNYKVSKGDEYHIQYNFTCNLLPGTYYITSGVGSIIDGKNVFLNRVVDAMVFKVQEPPNNLYRGVIHLYQQQTVKKI